MRSAFYKQDLYESHRAFFEQWLQRYVVRLGLQQDSDEARRSRMNQVNPRFVLRNYLAQQAIDAVTQGDTGMIDKLMDAARTPYADHVAPELTEKRPDWAINKPGCSMLSCSS